MYDEIICGLDIGKIAENISKAKAEYFGNLAYFINTLFIGNDEFIEKLDLPELAKKATMAEVGQFQQIVYLLTALGDRKVELIEKLDLAELAREANKAEAGQFGQIEALIIALGKEAKGLISGLLDKPNLKKLAEKTNEAEVGQFSQVGHLLTALGDRKGVLIEKLDLPELAREANKAEVGQFDQVMQLINALGVRKNQIIEKLDLAELAREANKAEVVQFDQIMQLINVLGDRKDEFIEKIDLPELARKANEAEVGQFEQIIQLIGILGERRNMLIEKIDWVSICEACPIELEKINVLGPALFNLVKQSELIKDTSGLEKVKPRLVANLNKLRNIVIAVYPELYGSLAFLIKGINGIDNRLAVEVMNKTTVEELAERCITNTGLKGVAYIIEALHKVKPELSEYFVNHNMVKGRINQYINNNSDDIHDEDLILLIKAFYRADRDYWIWNKDHFIKVDLDYLDLETIYKEVDGVENSDEGDSLS